MHARVWDVAVVRDKCDVIREAKAAGRTVQFGRAHGLCVEKNAELPDGHANRKYKGRVVFLGNRVLNQDYDDAVFEELGNAPANLESGRLADAYGACPGNASQTADGVQAYLQADMKGDACWVDLPYEARPGQVWGPAHLDASVLKAIADKWAVGRFPVTQLKCALYGHPDSVTYWELLCASELQKVDFVPLGSEWPSVFFHQRLKLLLTVYVDDFKMAGPHAHLDDGWALLRSRLDIGPESSSGMYLGCNVIKGQI